MGIITKGVYIGSLSNRSRSSLNFTYFPLVRIFSYSNTKHVRKGEISISPHSTVFVYVRVEYEKEGRRINPSDSTEYREDGRILGTYRVPGLVRRRKSTY